MFSDSLETLLDIKTNSFGIDLPDVNWYGSPTLIDQFPLLRTITSYDIVDGLFVPVEPKRIFTLYQVSYSNKIVRVERSIPIDLVVSEVAARSANTVKKPKSTVYVPDDTMGI